MADEDCSHIRITREKLERMQELKVNNRRRKVQKLLEPNLIQYNLILWEKKSNRKILSKKEYARFSLATEVEIWLSMIFSIWIQCSMNNVIETREFTMLSIFMVSMLDQSINQSIKNICRYQKWTRLSNCDHFRKISMAMDLLGSMI